MQGGWKGDSKACLMLFSYWPPRRHSRPTVDPAPRLNGFRDHIPLVCFCPCANPSPCKRAFSRARAVGNMPPLLSPGTFLVQAPRGVILHTGRRCGPARSTATTTWNARIAKLHQPCLPSSARLLGSQVEPWICAFMLDVAS